jgi:hypothetical protein
MVKTVADFRDALDKIQAIHDETWTKDNFSIELTRGLTTIENARMEWNAARLKFSVLDGEPGGGDAAAPAPEPERLPFANASFGELCKFGLAMTWPLVLIALGALGVLVAVLLRH